MHNQYKRVLIKLSGEALAGEATLHDKRTLDYSKIDAVADVLAKIAKSGVQIAIVIGGGNIYRGRNAGETNTDRTLADHMGMLATAINSLAMQDALQRMGAKASVLSAIDMYQVCEPFAQRDALARLERGEIVIFACGTGRPFFSTDTAAALRALEIGAQILLCAKNIDGIYSDDPRKNPQAKRYEELTYQEVIYNNLQALDTAAIALCRDGKMPIFVFKLDDPANIEAAINGNASGTHIRN